MGKVRLTRQGGRALRLGRLGGPSAAARQARGPSAAARKARGPKNVNMGRSATLFLKNFRGLKWVVGGLWSMVFLPKNV